VTAPLTSNLSTNPAALGNVIAERIAMIARAIVSSMMFSPRRFFMEQEWRAVRRDAASKRDVRNLTIASVRGLH
jgi:hypothetical protein